MALKTSGATYITLELADALMFGAGNHSIQDEG